MMNTPAAQKRILIADDFAHDRKKIRRALPAGFAVTEAASVEEAMSRFETEDFWLAFVDVFLEPDDHRASGIDLGQWMARQIPVIYVSSKEDRTQQTLNAAKLGEYVFLDKNKDFADGAFVAQKIDDASDHFYSGLDIAFSDRSLSWGSIVDKLNINAGQRDDFALELQLLVRRAFNGWDEAASAAVRASRILLTQIGDPGENSVVFQVLPSAASNNTQAHVVLKLSRVAADSDRADRAGRDEHTQFNQFKNVIGGYGLRERRHARRCHFRAQVFSIPYYQLDETCAFTEYYLNEVSDPIGLKRIGSVTTFIFDRALGPLNRRHLTGDGDLPLAEYYRLRIKAQKRLAAIRSDLTIATRPSSLRISESHIIVHSGKSARQMRNPVQHVLALRKYHCVDELASTQLRHGDFHTRNVLVDRVLLCAWYLDYESMDEAQFHMVDHVEFESDILFALMDLDDDFELVTMIMDAITGPSLAEFGEVPWRTATDTHRARAQKALAAVAAIRACVRRVSPPGTVRPYYHALMYEALRVAGKFSLDVNQRWRALVAAAVIFDKLETVYADA